MSYCDGDDPSEAAGHAPQLLWVALGFVGAVLLLVSGWRP